jgi:hypothetical protein
MELGGKFRTYSVKPKLSANLPTNVVPQKLFPTHRRSGEGYMRSSPPWQTGRDVPGPGAMRRERTPVPATVGKIFWQVKAAPRIWAQKREARVYATVIGARIYRSETSGAAPVTGSLASVFVGLCRDPGARVGIYRRCKYRP